MRLIHIKSISILSLGQYLVYEDQIDKINKSFWLKDNLQFFNILKTPVPVNFKLEDFNISSEISSGYFFISLLFILKLYCTYPDSSSIIFILIVL